MSFATYYKFLERDDVCSSCGDLLDEQGDCYSCNEESPLKKPFVYEYAHEMISHPKSSLYRKITAKV